MMKPRKANRGARRAGDRRARREASVYVRTVLETVRDVSYVSPDMLREPSRARRRSSGGAERLRLRWLEPVSGHRFVVIVRVPASSIAGGNDARAATPGQWEARGRSHSARSPQSRHGGT